MSLKKRIVRQTYSLLDRIYLRQDRRRIRRTRNLALVPPSEYRMMAKPAYGEWCHVVGIFQTVMFLHLNQKVGIDVLDIGCGTGILGIASAPFLEVGGHYLGIDVQEECIRFCRDHYPSDRYLFHHLAVANPLYAPQQSARRPQWDVADASMNLVTALSVWTHLNEEDAVFYFREIDRVLKPTCKAIVTFFLLDESYYASIKERSSARSRYHNTPQNKWIFDQPSSESGNWFCPKWATVPEKAIGVNPTAMEAMLQGTQLNWVETYIGSWKEVPGVYFQDILVFEKQA